MNLLIVDDEPLEATIVERMVDKKSLNIEEIYIAYNMKQAIEVLETHEVSVLLTDIQMPKGSGLDLVRWIREQELDIVCIFLSSHDDFSYAKEAIRLEACEYLLKPVTKEDLMRTLLMAESRVEQHYQQKLNKKMASFWRSGRIMLKQEFWRKVLFEENLSDSDMPAIKTEAAENTRLCALDLILEKYHKSGISVSRQDVIYPVLLTWSRGDERGRIWSDSSIEFVLQNIAAEVFWGTSDISNIIINSGSMLILYNMEGQDESSVAGNCEILQQKYASYLPFCDIHIYINGKTKLWELRQKVEKLRQFEAEDIQKRYRVLNLKETRKVPTPYEKPDLKEWISGIFTAQYEKSAKDIQWYLKTLKESSGGGTGILNCFQQDFLQELYIVLEQKGIQASAIFKEPGMVQKFSNAVHSIAEMEDWINSLVEYLVEYQKQMEEPDDIVSRIQNYIKNNLDGELSRNTLAQYVFLHPDYLSHIFKEQVGVSISDYIINERVKKAKILLASTTMTISEVAVKIGYPNTAYFTKLFKRVTELTPKEYRNSINVDSMPTG